MVCDKNSKILKGWAGKVTAFVTQFMEGEVILDAESQGRWVFGQYNQGSI